MSESTTIKVKVPGKLMVAGEYAVLEPNQQLLVTAVDRFVYASIQLNDENRLTLESFDLQDIKWHYANQKVHMDIEDKRTSFVRAAMEVTVTYLAEQSLSAHSFSLSVSSELDDDQSGLKYGLGSSAAVVTSVVTAILTTFLRKKPSKQVIFKLAAIAHVKIQGSGSGADIAASTYGGLIQYTSFQADWLLKKLKETRSVTSLIEEEWIYLAIKPLNFPRDWKMYVGWTGTPASTGNLVGKILSLKKTNPGQFQQFITNSSDAVTTIIQGIHMDDVHLFYFGIEQNRHCLSKLGNQAQVEIETPLLKKLSDIAADHGGAGKLSGAGGGDCGIAFVPSSKQGKQLRDAWALANIKPLDIQLESYGAHELK